MRDILFKVHWEDKQMGLFSNQLSNVVEWEEYRDDVLFWKWKNDEIKKGSKLIIRQGQDAIFMFNGKVEGVFEDEGSFDAVSYTHLDVYKRQRLWQPYSSVM